MLPFPHPPQQGGPGGPQGPNGMMQRPLGVGGPMSGFPQPGMPNMVNNPGMGMPMGQSMHMGNPMNSGMMNPGAQGGMMGAHTMQQVQQVSTLLSL